MSSVSHGTDGVAASVIGEFTTHPAVEPVEKTNAVHKERFQLLTSRECVRVRPSRCQSARRLATTTPRQSRTPCWARNTGQGDPSLVPA